MYTAVVTTNYIPSLDLVVSQENDAVEISFEHISSTQHSKARARARERTITEAPPVAKSTNTRRRRTSVFRNTSKTMNSLTNNVLKTVEDGRIVMSTKPQPPGQRRKIPRAVVIPENISMKTNKECKQMKQRWDEQHWLHNRGKANGLTVYQEKAKILQDWFEYLDVRGSGFVLLEELEEPLVSIGAMESHKAVRNLIQSAGMESKVKINLQEFVTLMSNKPKWQRKTVRKDRYPNSKTSHYRNETDNSTSPSTSTSTSTSKIIDPVYNLYSELTNEDSDLPFPVLATAHRRKLLLNGHTSMDPDTKRYGTQILHAVENARRDKQIPPDPMVTKEDEEALSVRMLLRREKKKKAKLQLEKEKLSKRSSSVRGRKVHLHKFKSVTI